MWKHYKDIDHDSNVSMYEITDNAILVMFRDHSIYCYSYSSAGRTHIEIMKQLAERGDGLNAYVNLKKVPYEWKEINGRRISNNIRY